MQGDEGHEELLDFIVDPAVVFGGVGECGWMPGALTPNRGIRGEPRVLADLLHPNHAQKTSGIYTTVELKYAGVVTWSGTPILVATYTSLLKSVANGLQYDSLTVRPSYMSADTAIEAPTAFILSPLKDLLEQLQVVDFVV